MEYRKTDSEDGYVLVAVIFLAVILLISLAIAAPKMAKAIQRDKELETIHRGEQYRRAIKLYYTKFGSYPTSIDQLVQTNEIRFLRRKYTDPMTGKDDWKPVFFGQAHVRPLGFFGQPLMTGAVGGNGSMYAAAPATTTDANGVPVADTSGGNTTGSTSMGSSGSGFGSGNSGLGSSGSSFGSSGSSFGQSGTSSMFGQSTTGTGTGTSNSPFGSSGTGTGTSATTFGGGGPIVGFTLPVDKASLIEYMQQKRYNKWEFNYDPAAEQAMAMAGLAGGAPSGMTTNPSNGSTTPGMTSPGTMPSNPNSAPPGSGSFPQ